LVELKNASTKGRRAGAAEGKQRVRAVASPSQIVVLGAAGAMVLTIAAAVVVEDRDRSCT